MEKKFDVFGVGNAIVDILAFVDDDFIDKQVTPKDINRGAMAMLEPDVQAEILQALEGHDIKMISGGSAANTMFGIALSGGTGAYSGKVADDPNGEFYRKDLKDAGIDFYIEPLHKDHGPTATSIILTTPDAERTMCTNLGVSAGLDGKDLDLDRLSASKILYMEGYLWFNDGSREACLKVAEHAVKNDVRVSLTLSDPFVVDTFRGPFQEMVKNHCDIVFCNADEARSFAETDSLDDAVKFIGDMVELAFITNSEDGAYVVRNGKKTHVPGFPVKPLDTTGAGDSFAAGVLYGLTNGYDDEKAARWGNYLASETVLIPGARLAKLPEGKMAEVLT